MDIRSFFGQPKQKNKEVLSTKVQSSQSKILKPDTGNGKKALEEEIIVVETSSSINSDSKSNQKMPILPQKRKRRRGEMKVMKIVIGY